MFHQLEQINGVKKVHNLRVWALTLDKESTADCHLYAVVTVPSLLQVIISAHLSIDAYATAQVVLKDASLMLERQFGVFESTIQIEQYNNAINDDCDHCAPMH